MLEQVGERDERVHGLLVAEELRVRDDADLRERLPGVVLALDPQQRTHLRAGILRQYHSTTENERTTSAADMKPPKQ